MSQLRWSKDFEAPRAYLDAEGHAITVPGYFQQALYIADAPQKFAEADVEKAIRVFRGQHMNDAAKTLTDKLAFLREIRRRENEQ